MDTDPLPAAIAHAQAYAAILSPDDVIDVASGFTAADLRALIAAASSQPPATAEDVLQDRLGDLA